MPSYSDAQRGDPQRFPDVLPALPLRDVVVFPYIILPLSIGRDRSLEAVESALADHRTVALVKQRQLAIDDPGPEDLHTVGTAAVIMRMLKLPDGRVRVLVQGLQRIEIEAVTQTEPFLQAKVRPIEEPAGAGGLELQALVRSVRQDFERVAALGKGISSEVLAIAAQLEDPGRLADLIASNLELGVDDAQRVLATIEPAARLQMINASLTRELELLTMQHEISSQARGEIDRNQRDYFLRQQLKAIRSELGEGEELAEEIAGYRSAASEKGLSAEAERELDKQLRRLERSHPDNAETAMLRSYLDWLTGLPWAQVSEDQLDVGAARRTLDRDHFGLDEVKERIVEYLAVRKLNPGTKGPILCFVGPPGVGKTSLGRSIAGALGRRFVRMSLGGVRDEGEIRGHRRTYVGALPGRILQSLSSAGTSNPVFMLDEVDKLGVDFRGDPSAALLEVLDPEQNNAFVDHYLGVPYDLSRVLFITTANVLHPIQPAFLDRMEVIELSGYVADEKVEIARRHLLPRLLSEHGIGSRHLRFTRAAIRRVIRDYTKEAGLRNLERELARICRKIAVRVASDPTTPRTTVGVKSVESLLGPALHFSEELLGRDQVGVATGLAWTPAGGDLLFIEAVGLAGSGKLVLTGQLGKVMKESAQTALTYARARFGSNGEGVDYLADHDIHVHAPAGSIPKDGPSAGVTIAAALVSVLTRIPVDRRVALSGEVTLRGDVLPIGGLKQKVLAARSAGVRRVVLPRLNRRDLAEIDDELKQGLDFHLVDHLDEVVDLALVRKPPRPTAALP